MPHYELKVSEAHLWKILSHTKLSSLTRILQVLSFYRKNGMISNTDHYALKTEALKENAHVSEGIISAAVELLGLDHDINECLDTFQKFVEMSSAPPQPEILSPVYGN